MIFNKYLLLFLLQLIFFSFYAHSSNTSSWVFNANIGLGHLSSTTSTLGVTETETDTLQQTKNSSFGQLSAGIGYEFALASPSSFHGIEWFTSIKPMLNYYYFANEMHGEVYQYQLPEFNNYQYSLNVSSNRLMLDAYFTVASWAKSHLFVVGGLGEGWNRITYFDTPYTGVPNGQINLKSRVNNGLAEEVGTGISYQAHENLEFFFQYLYTHFKSAQTGSQGTVYVYAGDGPIQVTPAKISLNAQFFSIGFNIKLKD